jgi:hypothetical protein
MPGTYQYPQQGEGERDLCIPRFYLRPTLDQKATDEAGHPVFKDEEFVEIIIPKSKDFRPVYKVTEEFRRRWPQQYGNFKQSLSAIPDGFRLDEWSMMPRSISETLKSLQIYTMEQFILIPEEDLKILGPGIGDLQVHAREVIENRDEKQEQIDELSAQNAELLQRLERLEEHLDEPKSGATMRRRKATPKKKKKELSDAQLAAIAKMHAARDSALAAKREDKIPVEAPLKG